MQGSRLTAAAERAGSRYALFLGALESVFSHHARAPEPGAERIRRQAQARAYTLAETFLAGETPELRRALDQEAGDAVRVTLDEMGLPPAPAGADILAHVETIAEDLENALRVQLERDIASMTRGLRDMALRGALMARAKGVSRASALASLRAGNTIAPRFTYTDRAGRRWPSPKLVRTIWRQALLNAWNETAMLAMAERGVTQARIEHPDAAHAERGTLVSLAEDLDGLAWAQIREDAFHPNSSAWLSPVLSQP